MHSKYLLCLGLIGSRGAWTVFSVDHGVRVIVLLLEVGIRKVSVLDDLLGYDRHVVSCYWCDVLVTSVMGYRDLVHSNSDQGEGRYYCISIRRRG